MPFFVGEMNGPSQCAPSDSEPSNGFRAFPDGPKYCNALWYTSGFWLGSVGKYEVTPVRTRCLLSLLRPL